MTDHEEEYPEELVLHDYAIEGIHIDWKRFKELRKKLQRVIEEERERKGEPDEI